MKRTEKLHFNCGIQAALDVIAATQPDTPRERFNLIDLAKRIRARKVPMGKVTRRKS